MLSKAPKAGHARASQDTASPTEHVKTEIVATRDPHLVLVVCWQAVVALLRWI